MKISLLLETLTAPLFQRRPFIDEFGGMDKNVICYHVTEASNEQAIRENGIKARECQQGRVTRQAACYLFVSKEDAYNEDVHKILGISNPVVIKVKLTGDQLLDRANYDGMFNASFEEFGSAIQYLDDISPEAIR